MYIPLVIGGLLFGAYYGTYYGLVAGLLMGLLINHDGFKNDTISWVFRLVVYTLSSFISGIFASSLRKSNEKYLSVLVTHPVTKLNNINYLVVSDLSIYEEDSIAVTILINHYEKLIKNFGQYFYNKILVLINNTIDSAISSNKLIATNNSNLFYLIVKGTNPNVIIEEINNALEKELELDNIPIYFEYSTGFHVFNKLDIEAKNIPFIFTNSTKMAYNNYNIRIDSVFNKDKLVEELDYKVISDFKEALDNNDLYLVYQPIVSRKNCDLIYLEALIRWEHETLGFIAPDRFIPLIEKTKLINHLTYFVLEKSLKLISEYKLKGINIYISINVLSINISDNNFITNVVKLFSKYDVSFRNIEFEITENTLVEFNKETLNKLNNIKKLGIKVTMDDFGTGYSSLSYLRDLKLDFFKLDKSFIDNINLSNEANQIIKYTIKLANSLNLEMVAEGVETKEQDNFLREQGCHYMQGYYYSKPFKKELLDNWIKNKKKMFD